MKDKLFFLSPVFLQEVMISLFNYYAYKIRYGDRYKEYRKVFLENRSLSYQALQQIQADRFIRFLKLAKEKTTYYKDFEQVELAHIDQLPILSKEILRRKSRDFFTISRKEGIVSKTGGTTGKSLEILFSKDNMQERFALLDDFRSRLGYELGKKTAWFSGKNLLGNRDIRNIRFWKTDYWHKVRYYSTFHISEKYLKYYVENLIEYQPEFIIGFPSSILEIAKYGLKNGYVFPEATVKAVFPTAETLTPEMYEIIEGFFKTKMYNQYASSEGAPFIFECVNGNLHLELQSGVFEVLDDYNRPATEGKLVVTSFTTEGTPLIRYDIGDSLILEDETKTCSCGNNNPLVKEILGRIDDYIYSPQNGKINLGNVSNTLKDTKGIIKFQAIQNDLNKILLKVIKDDKQFSDKVEKQFLQNWHDRVGATMDLDIQYVDDIPAEKSGKFRMVKNNIKALIEENTARI